MRLRYAKSVELQHPGQKRPLPCASAIESYGLETPSCAGAADYYQIEYITAMSVMLRHMVPAVPCTLAGEPWGSRRRGATKGDSIFQPWHLKASIQKHLFSRLLRL